MTKSTSGPDKGIAAAEAPPASPIKTDTTPRKLDILIPDACSSCKNYVAMAPGVPQGKCRLHPPTPFCIFMPPAMVGQPPQPYMVSDWPIVNADQWCGDFNLRRESAN